MKELQVAPLNILRAFFWSKTEDIRALLSPLATGVREKIEVIYQRSIFIVVRRLSAGGGIAPSFHETWQLILISERGPERVQILSAVDGVMHLIRHIRVECDETETLLGTDVLVRVVVPDAMTNPHYPLRAFLIHVEGITP